MTYLHAVLPFGLLQNFLSVGELQHLRLLQSVDDVISQHRVHQQSLHALHHHPVFRR